MGAKSYVVVVWMLLCFIGKVSGQDKVCGKSKCTRQSGMLGPV